MKTLNSKDIRPSSIILNTWKIIKGMLIAGFSLDIIGGIWFVIATNFLALKIEPIDTPVKNLSFIIGATFVYFVTRIKFKEVNGILRKSFKIDRNVIILTISFFLICQLSLALNVFIAYKFSFSGLENGVIVKILFDKVQHNILTISVIGNVFIAIGEEIIFRGFLLNYYYITTRRKDLAIILSSLVFSLIHFQYTSLLSHITAFIAGLVMAFSYLKFKTIYLPIGIHLSWNITFILLSLEEFVSYKKINNSIYSFHDYIELFQIITLLIILFILNKWTKRTLQLID